MAANNNTPKHYEGDLPMPDDGTEEGEGVSVLDQEAAEPAAKPRKGVRVRQTKKGAVEVNFPEAAEQQPAEPEGEIQSMVDVESVRPSLPKALRGVLTAYRTAVNYPRCEDGRTEAILGWAGEINDSPGFQAEVIQKWGGGKYELKGIDKHGKPKAFEIKLGGYSKPIPGTPEFGGYPNGAMPNSDGGFARDYRDSWLGGDQARREPEPIIDADGYYRPEAAAAIAQQQGNGLTGWVFDFARNMPRWMGPGEPPGPPPQGMGGTGYGTTPVGYNPSLYIHGKDKEEDSETTVLLKALLVKLDKPASDPLAGFAQMLAQQNASDKQRWEQERAAADRKAAADLAESRQRFEADQKERDRQHALMLAKLSKDEEVANKRANNEVKIAEINAAAEKDKAAAAIAQAKEMANLHAANSKDMIALVTANATKSDPMALFKQGVELAADLAGGKEDNLPGQISAAATDVIAATTTAVKDGMTTYYLNKPAAPPTAPGAPPQIAMTPEQQTNAQVTAANLQLVGYLVQNWKAGFPASIPVLRSGVLAYGLMPYFNDVLAKIASPLATPEVVVAQFKQGVQALGNPPLFVGHIAAVEQMSADPAGRAWFASLQAAIRKPPAAPVAPPPPPPPATGATIGAPPAPAAPAAPPKSAEQRLAEEQSKAMFGAQAPAAAPTPPKPGTTLS